MRLLVLIPLLFLCACGGGNPVATAPNGLTIQPNDLPGASSGTF